MRRSVILASTLAIGLISACQPGNLVTGSSLPGGAQQVPVLPSGALIRGQVVLPQAFATQATTAQLRDRASVMLIDPATNAVQCAGTTDASGAFTLWRSTTAFDPGTDDVFILDVFKRVDSGAVLSLRTYVKKTVAGWTSLTGSTVVVNLMTTAVAQIVHDESLSPEAVMGVLSGAPAYTTLAGPIGTQSSLQITAIADALGDGLGLDRDPVGETGYEHVGDVTISNAADAEAIRYVGKIAGDLIIDTTSMTSLDLPRLGEVTGSVKVGNFSGGSLHTLSLPRLRTVGQMFALGHTYGIYSANLATVQVPALQAIGGRLYVYHCDSLPDLAWSRHIQAISGGAMVASCPLVHNLEGLAVSAMENLELQDLQGLTSLTGLNPGLRLTRGLFLTDLPTTITSLAPFQTTRITGSVHIHRLNGLADLRGLDDTTDIRDILVDGCHGVATLAGIPDSEYLGLYDLPALTSFAALPGGQLRTLDVNGDMGGADLAGFNFGVEIAHININNTNVSDLSALSSIQSLVSLNLTGNANLSNLSGLGNLKYVANLSISSNPNLPSAAVTTLIGSLGSPPGNLYVTGNGP